MQIEQYRTDNLNLNEFLDVYDINMILNNNIISNTYFELYNYDNLYNALLEDVTAAPDEYIDVEGLTLEEIKTEIENYVSENIYSEVYQYFIIDESDLYLFEKYLSDYPIFYNDKLDLYLLGITHYGMSWSFFFTEAPRPQHMRIEKYDKILAGAGAGAK